MTQIHPTIRTMTWEEAKQFGLVNRGLMLNHETISYRLSAGSTDKIHVFRSGPTILVLTVNLHFDYLALDAYLGSEQEPIDSIFLQGEDAIRECIGSNWQSLTLATLATRLLNLFA